MANRWETVETVTNFIFWAPKSLQVVTTAMKLKDAYFLEGKAWPTYAAAKSLQSCPTLCNPIDGSSPGSPVPGILHARTLEWVAISFFNAWKWKVKVKSLSHVRLLATPWTAAYQAPPSMGFSRQVYLSGVPLPSPYGDIISIKTLGKLKVLNWHIIYCNMITTVANTSIISHHYHFSFVVTIFKIYSLSNFQVYKCVSCSVVSDSLQSHGL